MGAETGKLNKRLRIMRAELIDDGTATVLGEPAEIGRRWASKTDASDAERIRAAQQGSEVTSRFRMRADSLTRTIDATCIFELKGRRYEITGIKDVEGLPLIEFTTVAKTDKAW